MKRLRGRFTVCVRVRKILSDIFLRDDSLESWFSASNKRLRIMNCGHTSCFALEEDHASEKGS